MWLVFKVFFKYNNLPLDFLATAQVTVEYHNRDLSKEEIVDILNVSLPRDKAFYLFLAQSGIRPDTICQLQLKDLEFDRLRKGKSPVKINVTRKKAKGEYAAYFSFVSNEAIEALNNYLKTRANLTQDSLLFVQFGTRNKQMNPATFSRQFGKTVRMLKERRVLKFETPVAQEASDGRMRGKPSEIRLYNLRKFFNRGAAQAGFEYKEFWMGHKVKVVHNYISKDAEHHRQLYAEKAAPNLRIGLTTPLETDKQIQELRLELARTKEILGQMVKLWAKATSQEDANRLDELLDRLAKEKYPDYKMPEEKLKEKRQQEKQPIQ